MAIEISKENEGIIFIVKMSDKLSKEDYDRFVPEAESLIEKNGN